MHVDVDRQCLEKILSYCDRTIALLEKCNFDYETFRSDEFYLSISMLLMQIGEITGHFTAEFKTATENQIQWKLMKSMRNMFAHNYDNMDSQIIFSTATKNIPELKTFCEETLKSE
ncbi:MAG: DUF86 domain-containing protein [Ruminococcus sp.]|jgi:uncharacterized protein with HEPN domain|nr:DUF86 domain-containing protein [Ruminococcus sp.]